MNFAFEQDFSNDTPAQDRIESVAYDYVNKLAIAVGGNDQEVYRSLDIGRAPWVNIYTFGTEQLRTVSFHSSGASASRFFIGEQANSAPAIFVSDNLGYAWTDKTSGLLTASGGIGGVMDISTFTHPTSGTRIFAGCQYLDNNKNLAISDDYGETWSIVDQAFPDDVISFAYDSTNDVMYLGGNTGEIWESSDFGNTWSLNHDFGSSQVYRMVYDPFHDMIFASNGPRLYRSDNGGSSWVENLDTTDPPYSQLNILSMTYNPYDHIVWLGTFDSDNDLGGQVFATPNGGQTWTLVQQLSADANPVNNNYAIGSFLDMEWIPSSTASGGIPAGILAGATTRGAPASGQIWRTD